MIMKIKDVGLTGIFILRYGRHYVHDMLQSRTKYAYRVRAMDRERGIFSSFSDVLEVTTKRPPYTLQDLLIKITTNDMKVKGIMYIYKAEHNLRPSLLSKSEY